MNVGSMRCVMMLETAAGGKITRSVTSKSQVCVCSASVNSPTSDLTSLNSH